MSLPSQIARAAVRRPALRHAYGPHPSQVADLHLPRGRAAARLVVVLHGGFWRSRYGKWTTRPIALDLARRGVAAWNLEYRRVGGGGGWPATFDDVRAGIEALEALGHPRLDLSAGVDITGHSAGGQLALFAAAELPQVRRVAALAPVASLAAAGSAARDLMGGAPGEVPDRYAVADPLRRAPLTKPVLLVHPTDDATVSVRHSRAFAQAGGDVTLVEPPAGGHRAPIDPGSDAWRAAAEWLVSGGRAGGPGGR